MSKNSQGKIVLTFESDWHIGTGTGIPGSTDKLIFRDVDGFPCVPAKTLNGIWRDAMETLCAGLGNGWEKWVEFIFGIQPNRIEKDELKERLEKNEKTYSFSILNLRPARLSANLRNAISNKHRLKQSLTFIKAGIAIDNNSGTTKENHLRFEEMGRSGTILEAEFDLQTENETAKALLVLSAGLIERIGGKRRRGAGKCRFEIFNKDGKAFYPDALKVLEDTNGITPELPESAKFENYVDEKSKVEEKSETVENDKLSEWQTLEYRLTLQTPVSIVTAVLGNVSESLDFIPGTYLLPFITKNFGREIRFAVANGDFQVSPATIEIDGNYRGFPIPKVFAKEKMKQKGAEKEEIYNRLFENLEGKNQTKPVREGFISDLFSDTLSIATTPQTLLIHNTVDDKVQRPTSDVGGVFSREAIKAGTVLRGEIRWKDYLQLEDKDFENLKGDIRLGTSKKDDYGLVDFEIVGSVKDYKTESADKAASGELIVYFASDVLLRNDNLRQTNLVEDLAKDLSKNLGVGLKQITPKEGLISSIIQVHRIESWQVSWGFPRPTLTAMAAGSVVVFESEDPIDLKRLKEIEESGIGERRGEGYGQIIFNPKILEISEPKWQKGKLTEAENPNNTEKLDDDFAKQIELTAWREELKVAVLKIADKKELRRQIFGFEIEAKDDERKSVPPMNQIGGLRSVISRLRGAASAELVNSWLDHLKETTNRLEKWHKDKTTAFEKLQRIKKLVEEKPEVWRLLSETEVDGKPIWQKPKPITAQNLEDDENLWAEAVRALFYACQHAHKRELEKSKQKKEAANG